MLLNEKASVTDAELLALMNAWDLGLLEDHLSQRKVVCGGPALLLQRSHWVAV